MKRSDGRPDRSANIAALRAAAEKHLLFYGRDFSDVIIGRAAGAYMYDLDGRAILDFSSGQMCSTIGHNHPVIRSALLRSAEGAIHLDSTKLSPSVITLASELCEQLPPELQRAIFLNTGSESGASPRRSRSRSRRSTARSACWTLRSVNAQRADEARRLQHKMNP
jgi:2,2-dialkylglycine decarboxylase (pyruvate)